GLTANTNYTWKVCPDYGSGWTLFTATENFSTLSAKVINPDIGLSDNTISDLVIYPNPITYRTNISFVSSSTDKCYITLYDIIGKPVSCYEYYVVEGFNIYNISAFGLAEGIYFLEFRMKDEKNITKMVINR
ncbi:MAG: T9SS type A sorting domain-containing protein, partial [Bacteroidota bacterium]